MEKLRVLTRRVGISNIGDLLLGLASLRCELSYCQILVPEYQIFHSVVYLQIVKNLVYCIMIGLESMIKFGKVELKGPSLAFES